MVRRAMSLCVLAIAVTCLAGCGGDETNPLAAKLDKAKSIKDPSTRASELIKVSAEQRSAGDQRAADASLAMASSACDEIKDVAEQAQTMNAVAEAYVAAKKTSEAKDLLKKVATLFPKIEQMSKKVEVVAQMTAIYGTLGTPGTAYLEQVEADAAAIEDPQLRVQAMSDIAAAYHHIKETDRAAKQIADTLAAARAIEDPRQKTEAVIIVAAQYAKLDDAAKATELFQEAETLIDQIERPDSQAHALVSLASARSTAGQKDAAKQTLAAADKAADKVDASQKAELQQKIGNLRKRL